MSAAEALLHALASFRQHVATLTNSGALVTIEQHIGRLYAAAETGVAEGEAAAHELLAGLYGVPAQPAPAPAPPVPAPAAPVPSDPAPVEPPVADEPTHTIAEPAAPAAPPAS